MSVLLEMQTFLEIVNRGSLSAAARAMSTVPSTISARLSALEDRLGVALLVRSTRRLRLTDEGERYLVDCRRILDEIERTEACIGRLKGSLRGSLRITAPSDLGRGRLRPILDAFAEEHPRVQIHLHLSDGVVDLVRDGFDVALRTGELEDNRLVARKLARCHRVVCASPSYWSRRPRPLTPADLAEHECLLWMPDGQNHATWMFTTEDRGPLEVRVQGRRSSNDGELVRAWALEGLGIALKSFWAVERDLESGKLESVLNRYVRAADLYAVYPSRRHLPSRARALIDHLASAFATP
ncbi:LysR substrate-binding domain-containing protein [Pendulispora brunnea]|uniref:LysR substrate-binding domain-containing protein n=1 Tax=Pendulispora brunnea TaxID=2905690 RepID=A0ABZ2KHE8_9BACT